MTGAADRWAAPTATVATGGICALVAGVAEGRAGALSSLLGTLVVLGFFWTGIVPLLLVRGDDAASKGLATGILLLTYTLRLAAAVALLRIGAAAESLDRRWLGLSVIFCALAWTGAQVVRGIRAPEQTADPA